MCIDRTQLAAHKSSGTYNGVSHITSHRLLEPVLTRSDGVGKRGTKTMLPYFYEIFQESPAIFKIFLTSKFSRSISLESEVHTDLATLCALLMPFIDSQGERFLMNGQVLLGAFGILAYSLRADSMKIDFIDAATKERVNAHLLGQNPYSTISVAVAGKFDAVFMFEEESGNLKGSPLAVIKENG